MYIKKNIFVKITTVLFMIMLTGILYASVCYHFLNQTDGGFALGIYAGGLLLLLLMVLLILKLTAFKKQERHEVFIVVEVIAVLLLMGHGLFLRTLSEVVFNSQNTAYFDTAASLQYGIKMPNMAAVVESILDMPALFGYGKVMSYGFSLFGRKPEVLYYANLLFQMLSIFFIYRITRRLAGKQSGIVALILCTYLPAQIFSVYTLNNEAMFSCLFFGALWLSLYLGDAYRDRVFRVKGMLCQIVLGALLAVMIFIEPLSAILAVILLLMQFLCHNSPVKRGLITALTTAAGFAGFLFLMSFWLMTGYSQVALAYGKAFMPDFNLIRSEGLVRQITSILKQAGSLLADQGADITANYESLLYMDGLRLSTSTAGLLQAVNQFICLWVLFLSLLFGVYLLIGRNLRAQDRRAVLPMWLCMGAIVMLLLQPKGTTNTAYYVCLLIMLSGVALKYIYLGFVDPKLIEDREEDMQSVEPEEVPQSIEPEEVPQLSAELQRSVELQLSKELQRNAELQQNAEVQRNVELQRNAELPKESPEPALQIQYIENPLPLPQKHVRKNRIDYSMQPTREQMKYDIEVPDDADWDYK